MNTKVKNNEKGMALILVVSVIAVVMLLVMSMLADSNVAELASNVASGRSDLRYSAESSLSRALWLYNWDRKRYSKDHQNLGTLDIEREEDIELFQPWLANGNPHWIKEDVTRTRVRVHDAARGKDISKSRNVGQSIRKLSYIENMEDEEKKERLITLSFAMDDYVDSNDMKVNPEYGWELEDYEKEQGLYDFPANQPFQLKEEVYWMPEISSFMQNPEGKVIDHSFRIIPPRTWNSGGPRRVGAFTSNFSSSKESTFSTPTNTIAQESELEEYEVEELNLFRKGEIDWMELNPDLKTKINKFSRKESGIATFEITSYKHDGEVSFTLKYTADCRSLLKSGRKFFHCWEQVLY